MTVLFKDLTARLPQREDRVALTELMRLCSNDQESMPEIVLDGLTGEDAQLVYYAWVVVAAQGQLVGFACSWREDHEHITMYLCVHPAYRERGIGTLLLRMVEMRARQLARQAPAGQRVVLQGLMHSTNEGARRLFQHEGYTPAHAVLRISCALGAEDEARPTTAVTRKFIVNVDLGRPGQSLGTTALSEQDVLCRVQRYERYEKELRPVPGAAEPQQADRQALSV